MVEIDLFFSILSAVVICCGKNFGGFPVRHVGFAGEHSVMQVIITAVGPDNLGLADPIVHYVTGAGANISEIQMYDRDSERLFAMLMRIEWSGGSVGDLRRQLLDIGRLKGLQVRVWSRDEHQRVPRLAICTTYRTEPPLALLRAVRDRRLRAEIALMAGNRDSCRSVAEQF